MTSDTIDAGFSEALDAPRFANFGPRFLAYLLDFIIVAIPAAGAGIYFSSMAPNAIALLLITLLISFYKPVMEGLFGATLGKMLVKLRVVDKEGNNASIVQAFLRWLPFIIGSLWSMWTQYEMVSAMEAAGVAGFAEAGMFQLEYQEEMTAMQKYLPGALGLIIPLISALVMLGNNKRQSGHDMIGDTFVIHTKPKN